MKKGKTQGFVHGAAVLATAGAAVKIIGALYKIPLGAILGPVGMADFSIAYNIYALLFVIATAGVPVAVSKLVSESVAKGRLQDAAATYKTAYMLFVMIGAVGSAAMFFGSERISAVMGSTGAGISVRAISPAVLFVSMSAVNRGYFQGRSNMFPTAISEVIEALGKLVIGLITAWWLKRNGADISTVAAGAVLGVTLGALFSAVYFAFCKDDLKKTDRGFFKKLPGILKRLLSLAVPITLGAAVISLSNVIDSALVMNLLQRNGMSMTRAKWLFGAYSYATTLFNLPSALITTLAVSLLPTVSSALARGDLRRVTRSANTALAISETIAIPAACGMIALSYGIVELLYGVGIDNECVVVSSRLLSLLSFAIPLVAITTITNSLHQALGHANTPVLSMLAGAAVKIISNLILVGRAEVNIYGAAISTVLCYGTIALVNVIAMARYSFIELDISSVFAKPALLGAGVFVSAGWASRLLNSTLNRKMSTVLSVFVGVIVCAVMCFFVGIGQKHSEKENLSLKNIFKFLSND